MGIEVQVVTSAVRKIPAEWAGIDGLHLAVSIDGLEVDHDARRKPATYRRILENTKGLPIKVHCTITRQMTEREGYFREFLELWSKRDEVVKIWFSIFTPQIGAADDETLPRDAASPFWMNLPDCGLNFRRCFCPTTL
jgi:sulfatase maturation enzyme AslB (radical SAM superfamily)